MQKQLRKKVGERSPELCTKGSGPVRRHGTVHPELISLVLTACQTSAVVLTLINVYNRISPSVSVNHNGLHIRHKTCKPRLYLLHSPKSVLYHGRSFLPGRGMVSF